MNFGELKEEIRQASNVQEAIEFVRRARDIEYELHCMLCALCGNEPHGKRGFSSLSTMVDCVKALDSHATKIEDYAVKINSHEAGLEQFNKTIGRIQQAYDSVSHLLHDSQPTVQAQPRKRFSWWRRND
jgi:hypothetical protein|uniref:Uncharacterized protein n=1 Tax=Myoviridae sp. ctshb19 TaxID=2825194 RepID=A0A8S5UGJ3_9CAUD|nr:MAG TPA: hypothetical protein [Myoviridae sp. ctshb19]